MIEKEKREVKVVSEVIKDVICDSCGKSLANDNDFVNRIELFSLYFLEDKAFLGSTEFINDSLDLCDNCIKPFTELIKNIKDKKR